MDNEVQLKWEVRGRDFSSAGEAASRLKQALRKVGMDPEVTRRAAIATYEAEMNIVIHAYRGTITASISPGEVLVVADDEGPGIPDIELAMQEGYSTAPEEIREMGFGAGMGLPNIKRCCDDLEIRSEVGKGTTVIMAIRPRRG